MDSKIIAIIAVVIIAVAAVGAAVALSGSGSSDSKDYVYYDANGGKSAEGTEFKTTDLKCYGTNIFTRDGYSCIGWNTDKSATVATYKEGDAVKLGMRLYAVWKDESGPKLHVTSTNQYASVYNLSLNDTNIDKAWEYDLKGNDKIYITAASSSALFGYKDDRITIEVPDDKTVYYIVLTNTTGMTDVKVNLSGNSAVISFGFTVGAEVSFGYFQGENKY